LDEITLGWRPGELIIVAARPAQGKTALGIGLLIAAAKAHKRVGLFSLEMGIEAIITRMTAQVGMVDSARLQLGYLSEDEWGKIIRAAGDMSEWDVLLNDAGTLSLPQIRALVRPAHDEQPLDLVIVDYLQLLHAGVRSDNRVDEVGKISRGLKQLARELNAPVIALAQVGRSAEQHPGPPMLSDLRESGSIENDADKVIFIYRPEDAEDEGVVELIVAKHRNGPTGKAPVRWRDIYGQFVPAATARQIAWNIAQSSRAEQSRTGASPASPSVPRVPAASPPEEEAGTGQAEPELDLEDRPF
jgi:replicative DNA helicase